ncbi:MAG: hypothetical protein ACT4NX_00435 [Deltaproteobacteria bacterium]
MNANTEFSAVAAIKLMSLLTGLGVAMIYLAFLPPAIYSVDGNSMLAVSESLATRGDFTVPPWLGNVGADGRYYSIWYPLLSIAALPFVAAGLRIGGFLDLPPHYVAAVAAVGLNILLTSATASIVALLALRLGSGARDAFIAALGFAFGTIALVYARNFFAEPLLAFLAISGLYCALKPSPAIPSVASALSVLAKPTGVIAAPIFALYFYVKGRSLWFSLSPVIALAVGAALYALYNYARFASPFSVRGGESAAFDISVFPEGLAGLVASPGRGLIWYSPPVILAIIGFSKLVKSKPWEASAIAGLFFGYLLSHALLPYWHGGWCWGPRYLLPAIAPLMALSAAARWRRVAVCLLAIGFVVNAPTLVSYYERYYAELWDRGVSEQALLWSAADAPLLNIWGAAARQIEDARTADVSALVGEAGRIQDTGVANSQILKVVAVWWWMLPAAGIPRWVGALASALMIASGVLLLTRAWAAARNLDARGQGGDTRPLCCHFER